MGEVVPFPTKAPEPANVQEEDDYDLPKGIVAWQCIYCETFMFYITEDTTHCYLCHTPQVFD